MYKMLKNKHSSPESGFNPPLPLILAAWWDAPIIAKIDRFRTHLEWAEQQGQLDEIGRFLRSLPEDEWFYG